MIMFAVIRTEVFVMDGTGSIRESDLTVSMTLPQEKEKRALMNFMRSSAATEKICLTSSM